MSENRPKETVQGYEIRESIIFDNNRGFALAKNPNAPDKFVTWQFTENENGKRDYYWGRYKSDGETARQDYLSRVSEYIKDYGLSERGVYKYYSTQRPVDIGTFPKTNGGPVNIVNFDKREPVENGRFSAWGYLEYSAPLTERQLEDYELKAAYSNPDLKRRMEQQTQVVGHWEDMRKLPDEQRLTWHKPSIHAYALREPEATPEQLARRHELATREFAALEKREEQAQVVGKWEQAHRVPDVKRLTWWYPDFGVFVAKEFVTPAQLTERHRQITEAKNRAAERPPRIANQLAEGAAQAAKDNADRPAPGKNHMSDKDR